MSHPLDSLAVDVETAHKLILLHPTTGEPIRDKKGNPAYLMLLSNDGPQARKHRHQLQQRLIRKRGKGEITPEELDKHGSELIAALTTGWHLVNLQTGDAIDYAFTAENAVALYEVDKFAWIKEQADDFAGSRANFMRNSQTNSASGAKKNSD